MLRCLVVTFCFLSFASCGQISLAATDESPGKPNVLFIAVDDLRPEIGCYGSESVQTPHLDRLAGGGLVFERAYCQQAVCMASRASLLSGYRPDRGQIYRRGPLFEHVPDALTLNQHFTNNGYQTASLGKVYHHESDYRTGWTTQAFFPAGDWAGRGYLAEASIADVRRRNRQPSPDGKVGRGPAYESPDVPDEAYPDGVIAARAVRELNRLKSKPFFLAVGFAKPHLPFNAPKKYWDLYPEDEIELPSSSERPSGAPALAFSNWGELRAYTGMPDSGNLSDSETRTLIRGYRACVTYTDALIGRVLDELDRLELADNTIVVLWGDHGWKLGEYGDWCKHTNFELDTRVPLIVRAPSHGQGDRRTEALVELVDLYPSLCDLCGLELPSHLEGTSFLPLLEDPEQPWKSAAFSQYPRGRRMGYSIRDDRYRYTEWRVIRTDEVVARELYDYQTDPQGMKNLAAEPSQAATVERLATQLRAGYEAAKPGASG